MDRTLDTTVTKLANYCHDAGWAGYDPYDALNSKLFDALPIAKWYLPRLVLIQALKRSPVNLRSLLMVPKKQNAKAIALFLASMVKLTEMPDRERIISKLIDHLRALRSPGMDYWCWGYSFPWQTRTIIVPADSPNVVCTTFVAEALLDLHESRSSPECLTMAISAAEYLVEQLYWRESSESGFSYPSPGLRSKTHNANLMASAFL